MKNFGVDHFFLIPFFDTWLTSNCFHCPDTRSQSYTRSWVTTPATPEVAWVNNFDNKNVVLFYFKNALAYNNAAVVHKFEVVGLAPVLKRCRTWNTNLNCEIRSRSRNPANDCEHYSSFNLCLAFCRIPGNCRRRKLFSFFFSKFEEKLDFLSSLFGPFRFWEQAEYCVLSLNDFFSFEFKLVFIFVGKFLCARLFPVLNFFGSFLSLAIESRVTWWVCLKNRPRCSPTPFCQN
jgi:hypothetical protein